MDSGEGSVRAALVSVIWDLWKFHVNGVEERLGRGEFDAGCLILADLLNYFVNYFTTPRAWR